MKKVYITILNYNTHDKTIECIKSLKKLKTRGIDLNVVLIDNNSKEKFEIDENDYSDINLVFIKNEENLGFSGGHNMGFSYALEHGADFVVPLNSDTIVDESLIEELIKPFERDDRVGITVPKIYFAKGSEFHKGRYKKEDLGNVIWYAGGITDWNNVISSHRGVDEVDRGQYDEIFNTEFATGACFMISCEVLKRVGMFDDKYFLYYEDGDLNVRVKKAGYKILYTPKAFLWHSNAGSGGGSGSSLQDYYITRNRLLFGFSHAPLRAKLALLRESIRVFKNGREWQKRGVRDFYFRKFGKGSFFEKVS